MTITCKELLLMMRAKPFEDEDSQAVLLQRNADSPAAR